MPSRSSSSSSSSQKRARSGSVADLERPAKRLSPETHGDTPPTSSVVSSATVPEGVEVIDLTEDTPPSSPLINKQPAKQRVGKTPIPADAQIIDLTQDDNDEEEDYILAFLRQANPTYHPTELGTGTYGGGGVNDHSVHDDTDYSDEDTDSDTYYDAEEFPGEDYHKSSYEPDDELDGEAYHRVGYELDGNELDGEDDDIHERAFTYDAPETLNDGRCFDCHERLTFGHEDSAPTFVANSCKAVYCGDCVGDLNQVMCRKHPFPVQGYHELLEMDCIVCWEDKEDWQLLDLPCGHPVCASCCTTWANTKDDQEADANGEPIDVDTRGEKYFCGLCPSSEGFKVEDIFNQYGFLHHEEDRF